MRKRLWTVATILSALALLGTVAGAANTGADPTTFGLDGLRANISSNAALTAVEQATEANQNDANETEADNDDNPVISASTESAPSGTSSARPGWGCGDTNHEHSGPPGRPGATPPPGCDKAGAGGQSGSNSNSANHQTTSPSLNNPGKHKGK